MLRGLLGMLSVFLSPSEIKFDLVGGVQADDGGWGA